MRVFQTCRPRDIESYYFQGLRYLRPEEALLHLRELIAKYGELAPLREESRFKAAVGRIESDNRAGRLYVGLDDRDLLERAGHYLIYGSEFLAGVLAYGGGSFQQPLKREGIPTVFILDVPVSLFSSNDIRQFARQVPAQWARNIVHRRYSAPPEDFTFALRCDIPTDCIVGHYHPERINDPLNHFVAYRNPHRTCPQCAVGRC